MKAEFLPAIEALQKELREDERKVAETKSMINRLCLLAGGEPRYSDVRASEQQPLSPTRSDQFYGKVQQTAAREYLEMRHNAKLGPASPRDIYVALVDGGFEFDTDSETNRLTGLRATLRKNSSTFHRLPNGQYGLLSWYPNAKATKSDGPQEEGVTVRKRLPIARKTKSERASPRPRLSVTPFVLDAMKDGTEWTTGRLKEKAIRESLPGIDATTQRNVFHGALLSLLKKGEASQTGNGGWRLNIASTHPVAQVVPIKGAA